MKYSIYILAVMLLFTACSQKEEKSQEETNADVTVPQLLQRSAVIGPEDEMGKINDLYNELASKIKNNPEQLENRLGLAELFMQEARISGEHGHYFPAAMTLVEEVLEEDIADPGLEYRALLDKSSILLSLHQFDKALATGQKAVKINPYDAGIYGVLVDAHVELGNYKEAVKMADKMVATRPDIRSYSRISYLREIFGQQQGAIQAMKMAVQAGYPGLEQTEWARLQLGDLYLKSGKLDSAQMQYERALAARPNYPFAVASLARVEALKGHMEESEIMLKKAARMIPEVGFYIDLAKIEQEKGNKEKADKMTTEILAMLDDDEKAGHKMALEYSSVYMDLANNLDKALEYALKEYQARPNNIDVNKQLAVIYYRMNNLSKAEQHLQSASITNMKDPEMLCLSGLLELKNNSTNGGKNLIKDALALNPYTACELCKEARALLL